jgi:hypothetical protein
MPDPQQPQPIDLSAGLVSKTPATTDGIDLSAGLVPKSTENVQNNGPQYDDPTKNRPSNPDYYPGEGAIARGATSAYRAMGGGALGDTNAEVRQRLKEIAQHPVDKTLEFGKGILDQQGELAAKAKEAWKAGDHTGAAAYALYSILPGIGPSLAKSDQQLAGGDVAGGLGTITGTALPMAAAHAAAPEASVVPKTGFQAAEESAARESAAATAKTAEETAPKAKPLKAAGETVQKEAAATREAAGKKVGASKEAVQKSLPAKPSSLLDKNGSLKAATDKVLKDTTDAEQLAGAKDPDMADVRAMADHLSKGKNAAGDPLNLDPEHVESMKRAFNQKIDALQTKADAGGNATALRNVKNLKQAWQEDLYNAYEQHGDPASAQALKAASKEYAGIVNDQTSGPARAMFRNQSPEKIVSTIVNSGARSQSAVESLVRNMTESGKQTLRDSVLKNIYDKNTLPDGTIDMAKARKNFYSLGDTAKTLYGQDLKPVTDYLDAASKEQAARTAKAARGSIAGNVASKVAKGAAAAGGAMVGGPLGAATTAEAADYLFQNGKSGAVKIGISPTEKIVLSPTQATAARPLITKFLKAKSVGNPTAIASAYNAIANQKPQQNQ